MWRTQPNFSKAQLGKIGLPVTISDGEYDEIISLGHTKGIAASIVKANLVILPNVSHFAMLQDSAEFNQALRRFLQG